MDDGSRLSWLIVIILLFIAMYFAVAETAFASVSRTRLKVGADKGDPRAKKALYVTDHMDRTISTILIGTNIVHLAAASIVTVTVTKTWGASFVTLSTLLTTLAVFFFGEMLPKSIARKYSERFSLSCAGTLTLLMAICRPFSSLLTTIGNAAASLTKGDGDVSVTEEELYDIIEDMTEDGTLDEEQSELIASAISFGDVTAETIMTPLKDMDAIDIRWPGEDILTFIKEQNHSRLPVTDSRTGRIIGTLQIRKYLKNYIQDRQETDIRPYLDKPHFVYRDTNIDDLLAILTGRQINMAIVRDEAGKALGLVTVEDVLEELVGEIYDEDDEAVPETASETKDPEEKTAQENTSETKDPEGKIASGTGSETAASKGHAGQKGGRL